jgi:hypothetical protein
LRPPQLPEADASSLPWNGAVFGFEHRRHAGLTVIDIERERRDEVYQHELQAHLCDGAPSVVLDAVNDRLTTELAGVDGAPPEWRRMIDLTPELVYTLWVLGRRKHIGPVETDSTDRPTSESLRSDARDAWRFAMWIVERGPKCFGYAIDASAEILMAYRYLDCLDRIPSLRPA